MLGGLKHIFVRQGEHKRRKKNTIMTLASLVFALCFLGIPIVALAQLTGDDLGLQYGTGLGLGTTDIRETVGRVVNAFLGLLGIIVVVLFLYAGFLYMTARGNPNQVEDAKKIMINATIGLIIILSAYAIAAFIIWALTGSSILPGGDSGRSSSPSPLGSLRGGSSHLLGNGIIDYHYPEYGQTNVPRNTSISITFKRPLVLSTIFKDYDDNGTFDISDDTVAGGPVPAVLELNTDNIKIIPNADLGSAEGGLADERFDNRYPDSGALIDPAPTSRVTQVTAIFDPLDMQTVVITPIAPIGSSVSNVTYRVALRGEDNGIKVWVPNEEDGSPETRNAFDSMNADGGYFWTFDTGTQLDLESPRVVSVVPSLTRDPASSQIPRNQLLQIYFNEAVDPTTASGIIGPGGGFTNIEVKARCIVGSDCDFNDGGTFDDVPGKLVLGNRYRTAEFIPSAPCEGVTENSCGDPVYCLPRNVEIRVRALAATLSDNPPKASLPNGVLDMVGNSFDGNNDREAQGPESASRPTDYLRNNPLTSLVGINDTARWFYRVGTDIDLTEPKIINISPKSAGNPPAMNPRSDEPWEYCNPAVPEGVDCAPMNQGGGGPSSVPLNLPIMVLWDKTMSISSMRTGSFDELDEHDGLFTDDRATLALRSFECEKVNRLEECFDADGAPTICPCIQLDAPSFYIDTGSGPVDSGTGEMVTMMNITHRQFVNANALGYTEYEISNGFADRVPKYEPIIGARIKDTRQNCFYPSEGFDCVMGSGESCCNREGQDDFICPL